MHYFDSVFVGPMTSMFVDDICEFVNCNNNERI